MFTALGIALSLIVTPSPVLDDIDVQKLLTPKTGTIVALDVPWDGSDIEVSASAEAPPEPEPEPDTGLGSEGATSTDGSVSRMSVAVDGSTSDLLASIANMDHSALRNTPNGSVSGALLCAVPWSPGFSVYCPALEPLSRLNDAYRAQFGYNISFASAYRGGYQGRSFHGWGLALDLNSSRGLMGFGDPEYQWLLSNGPSYGWYHPFWAAPSGGNPEAWHWEFGSYYRGDSSDFNSAPVPIRPYIIKH